MFGRIRYLKTKRFLKKVALGAVRKVRNFVKGVVRHFESIIILVLASLGLNSLLGELPFYFALPMWIEVTMVIPVLAVLLISFLTKSAEWRAKRRSAKMAVA